MNYYKNKNTLYILNAVLNFKYSESIFLSISLYEDNKTSAYNKVYNDLKKKYNPDSIELNFTN